MKLKLKNPNAAPEGAPAPAASASQPSTAAPAAAAPKLALKFKPVAASTGDATAGPTDDAPKAKRKYTKKPKLDENGQPLPAAKPGPKPKKRQLEDGEEAAPAKRKVKPTLKSLSNAYIGDSDDDDEGAIVPNPVVDRIKHVRQNSLKLSLKKSDGGGRSSTAILKVKGVGRPPPRPPGVGYDSEAEEAEEDPAIESQFVLRMAPGPDNDLLRKSIDEKTIGKSQGNGGPGVQFRFFDREGRKAMITIQGRMYAASMVELPCVIESLKSWNKKDWVKTADVCQMLLVLGRVNSEDEAKKFTRPREVEPDSHRYPHGLTPPMRYVRKRRFRPRKSYLDVERIETATEELLAADEACDDTKYELIDSDAETSEEESEDEDAQGEDEDMMDYAETPVAEQVDVNDLMEMFDQEHDDDQVEIEANGAVDDLFGDGAEIEVETPIAGSAHEVAMHALSQHRKIVLEPESAVSTPAAATSPDDDDDDDDGDDDDDDDDPEAAARQHEIEQKRAEIKELDDAIEEHKARLANTPNVLYKKRLQVQIDQLVKDKQVKMSAIGETDEDED